MHVANSPQQDGQLAIKATLLCAGSLTVMSGALLAPALPGLTEHFADIRNIDSLASYVLLIPNLVMALVAPFVGNWMDRAGRLRIMRLGVLVYGVAGTLGYFLDSFAALLASRVLFGLGAVCSMVAVTTLVGDYFSGEERNRFSGLQGTVGSLVDVVVVQLGSALALLDWRNPFLLYMSAFLLLVMSLRFLREPPRAAAAVKAHAQAPAPHTAFDWLHGKVVAVYASLMLGMICYYQVFIRVPFIVGEVIGGNAFMVGSAVNLFILACAGSAFCFARVYARLGYAGTFTLLFALVGCGYTLPALLPASAWTLLPCLVIAGLGAGLLLPCCSMTLMALTPAARRATVMGAMISLTFLGNFISGPLLALAAGQRGMLETLALVGAGALVLSLAWGARLALQRRA